jgi:hypothetical protein
VREGESPSAHPDTVVSLWVSPCVVPIAPVVPVVPVAEPLLLLIVDAAEEGDTFEESIFFSKLALRN